jgi:hypothetical protein
MAFYLVVLSDFVLAPLLTLLELFFMAAWISFVLIIPDRIFGRCLWVLIKVLLFVLSAPYLAVRWIFLASRPIDCRYHSLFCQCKGCRVPEEEMNRMWRSHDEPRS